jgi:hypothetical protein
MILTLIFNNKNMRHNYLIPSHTQIFGKTTFQIIGGDDYIELVDSESESHFRKKIEKHLFLSRYYHEIESKLEAAVCKWKQK